MAAEPLAEIAYRIAEDQPERYAAASGDDFAIHLDDEFARSVGLPGRIVHGLCTMAFATRAVLEAAEIDDPRRVRRVAVRFSAPLFPGDTVTTRVWRTDGGYGFESLGGDGAPVLKDGLLELGDDRPRRDRRDRRPCSCRGRAPWRGRPAARVASRPPRGTSVRRRHRRSTTLPRTTGSATWQPSCSASTPRPSRADRPHRTRRSRRALPRTPTS